MKKKKEEEKRKKKKEEMVQKFCWATAQLCHNTVRNYIVTQPVRGCSWLVCIAIGRFKG